MCLREIQQQGQALSTYPAISVRIPRRQKAARLRLFCLPYAGAGASIFYPWSASFPDWIEVCALQLPGREERLHEPLCSQLALLVPAIAEAIAAHADRPFACFGHSLGALLAFEATHHLTADAQRNLIHLLLSGAPAPQCTQSLPTLQGLSDAEFRRQAVQYFRGFAREIVEEPELLHLFLSILRADLGLLEQYHPPRREPLACALTTFGGWQDISVRYYDLLPWHTYTTGPFTVQMFSGDHFFLQTARTQLIQTIIEQLRTPQTHSQV